MTVVASARALVLVSALLLAGCSEPSAPTNTTADIQSETPTMISPSGTADVRPEVPTMVSPKTTLMPPSPPAAVRQVSADDLGVTWRPECPLDPEKLRLVEIDYRGFDGATHRGELVVHEDLVNDVQAIFASLLSIGYPIERMQTPEHYPGAEDELSMEDNNTSAFNCRGIPGSSAWSEHAYGRAIDINPLINPYISASGRLEPTTAAEYLDRSRTDQGMLHDGDAVVQLFAEHGWAWGGHWQDPKDYQHFEHPSP